jgi:RHS repeat-associated protein
VQELQSGTPSANLLTGLGIDEYFQRTDSGGAMNFLTDALGSRIALTDSSGAVNTSYAYEPFGNVTISGANANSYQFTGRENDGTGLYFYRARYYSATLQRFISQDPIGFDGGTANLYQYALGAPTAWVDPLGLDVTMVVNVGATPLNHMTIAVNGDTPVGLEPEGSWDYPAAIGLIVPGGITVPGEIAPSSTPPMISITIPTTPAQDAAIEAAIEQAENNPPNYNAQRNNCAQEADQLLRAGGLSTPGDVLPIDELKDLAKMYNVPITSYHLAGHY